MFGYNSKNFVKMESYMHGVLNIVYLQNLFTVDATLRVESNEPN